MVRVHGVSSDYLLGEGRGRGAYPSALSAVEYWLCGKRAPGEGMEQGGGVNTITVRSTIYRTRIVLFGGA